MLKRSPVPFYVPRFRLADREVCALHGFLPVSRNEIQAYAFFLAAISGELDTDLNRLADYFAAHENETGVRLVLCATVDALTPTDEVLLFLDRIGRFLPPSRMELLVDAFCCNSEVIAAYMDEISALMLPHGIRLGLDHPFPTMTTFGIDGPPPFSFAVLGSNTLLTASAGPRNDQDCQAWADRMASHGVDIVACGLANDADAGFAATFGAAFGCGLPFKHGLTNNKLPNLIKDRHALIA